MDVYRVTFWGPADQDSPAWLEGPEVRWEGSESGTGDRSCHRALAGAVSPESAMQIVRQHLAGRGEYEHFEAVPVRGLGGGVTQTPIRKRWDEIDWSAVARKAQLSELQRGVLGQMLDAAEPTWMILDGLNGSADRETVEQALKDLERLGLVRSTWESSGEPGRVCETERWSAVTDEGWSVLGLIKSPRYH